MTLPETLVRRLRDACGTTIDASETIKAVAALLGDSECRDFMVWTGPGYGEEDLLLDVYALSDDGLYNYWLRSSGLVQASCSFWDTIASVGLSKVDDERSPLILAFAIVGQDVSGRIYGKEEDRDRLVAVLREIIELRQMYKPRSANSADASIR